MMDDNEQWIVEEDRPMYQNLRIYEQASRTGDEIWDIVSAWSIFAQDTLGKQIVRAVDSIAANLAEGSGRGTNPEILRFARIARGSLCETQHWITRAKRRNLLVPRKAEDLEIALESLLKQVNAYISKMSKKR